MTFLRIFLPIIEILAFTGFFLYTFLYFFGGALNYKIKEVFKKCKIPASDPIACLIDFVCIVILIICYFVREYFDIQLPIYSFFEWFIRIFE